VAITASNLGLLQLCLGEYENAESSFDQSAGFVKKTRWLKRSFRAIVIYNNLAISQMRLNNYFDAEATARQALEIAESPRAQRWYRLFAAAPLTVLGAIHLRLGELESAVEEFQRALQICESSPTPRRFPNAKNQFAQCQLSIFLGLAIATIRLGKDDESQQWCTRALSVMAANRSLVSTLTLENLTMLANEFMNKKLFSEAECLLDFAYMIGRNHPFHPDAKQLLNYYEKLLLLTDRQSDVNDMRSWVRHVEINALRLEQQQT
jgi:tetratricopeptide (TPR) repeat protein